MADVENEVLDWENEDDEQQQQNFGTNTQSSFDNDADDVVSLGDEDEVPVYFQEAPVEPDSMTKPSQDQEFRSSSRERGAMSTSRPSSRNVDAGSGDRYEREFSGHRQRARRGSSPRRRGAPQSSARLTHALPPKPVAPAPAPPGHSARAMTMQGTQHSRPPGSDTISANDLSPGSPAPHSSRADSFLDWEARVSSKGETYYYNRATFQSTWDAPPEYRPFAANGRDSISSDGRQGRQNVSTHSFRSSPSQSDMASQDPPPRRPQPEEPARPSRNARSDAISEDDRYYRPKDAGKHAEDRSEESYSRDSRRERAVAPSASATQPRSRGKARSPSPSSQDPYHRSRENERSSNRDPEPAQRDRISVTNSAPLEQRAPNSGESGRVSRQADMDTYIPSEDRTRPPASRRQSSPPRHTRAQSPERLSRNQPNGPPRRRPSPPPPPSAPASVPPPSSRSNERRHVEPALPAPTTSSTSVPRGPKSRGDPIMVSLPTGPAASNPPRYTNPRSRFVEVVYPDQPNYARVRDNIRGKDPSTSQPSRTQQGTDGRERPSGNSSQASREPDQPTRKSGADSAEIYATSREREPPRAQDPSRYSDLRPPPPPPGLGSEDNRSGEIVSRRPSTQNLRPNDIRSNDLIDPPPPAAYRGRSPDRQIQQSPASQHVYDTRTNPQVHRPRVERVATKREQREQRRAAAEASEGQRSQRGGGVVGGVGGFTSSSRNQDIDLDDVYNSRSSRGKYSQEELPLPSDSTRTSYRDPPEVEREWETRRDGGPPSAEREVERGREHRREPSPKKGGKRDCTRKLVSGTNNTPLGRNRFSAPGDGPPPPPPPARNSGHAPSRSPVQTTKPLHPVNSYDYAERSRDPVPETRREIYDRPPEPSRYSERSREPRYESPPRGSRRTSPNFASRVSDPYSMPPHMANSGREKEREPRGEPRSGARRDRGRERTPSPRRIDSRLPTESRSLSSLPEKPTPSDMRLERSSGSWKSDAGRRASDVMAVDGGPDRYTPPTDRLKDSLRVSSSSSSRDVAPPVAKIMHPSLPPPPIVHPLPQKPMLVARQEQQQPPPLHGDREPHTSPSAPPARDDHKRRSSRWDAPLNQSNPTTTTSADVDMASASQAGPVSPRTSKKVVNEITPPRLRRPDTDRRMQIDPPLQGGSGASGSGYGGPRREDHEVVQGRKDRADDRERDGDGSGLRERGGGGRGGRSMAQSIDQATAPPLMRSNSLLERLTDAPPPLRDRVSVPSKRDRDEMGGGGGFDDSYDFDDAPELGSKRRRKGGGRSRRAGNAKRHP